MANRCEFGHGNRGFARVARGTVSGSNPVAVAALMRTMMSGAKPVAPPISPKDETAHSIDEVRDSTTLIERRGPTCGQGCSGPMEGAIALERGLGGL
jgi:hypothetical protein